MYIEKIHLSAALYPYVYRQITIIRDNLIPWKMHLSTFQTSRHSQSLNIQCTTNFQLCAYRIGRERNGCYTNNYDNMIIMRCWKIDDSHLSITRSTRKIEFKYHDRNGCSIGSKQHIRICVIIRLYSHVCIESAVWHL